MNKGTLILFSVVVALSGFTYAMYQRSLNEEQSEKQASVLFGDLDADDVREVRIQSGQKEIHLQKHNTNSRWYVMAPVKDRADDRSVEEFLTELKEQNITPIVEDPGQVTTASGQSETFGLDRSYWQVRLVNTKGLIWKAQISAKRAFDGSLYLQKVSAAAPASSSNGKGAKTTNTSDYLPQVYTAGEGLVSVLEKKSTTFQSKMMFEKDASITEAQFLKVNLKHKSRSNLELHLEKNQVPLALDEVDAKTDDKTEATQTVSLWQIRGRHHEPLEQQKVENFLESIRLFQADEVVENQKTGDLYEKYQLYKPDFKIQVEHEKGLWELRISEGKDKFVYMTSSSSLGIYKIRLSAAEVLYRKEDAFLDFSKPFDFDVKQVQKITLHTENEQKVFVLDDENRWHQKSQALKKGETVAPEKVEKMQVEALESPEVRHDYVDKLIEDLRDLRVEKFYSPKKKLNFTDKDETVEFKSADDNLIFEMKWRKLGTNYAALTNLFDGLVEVDKSQLDKTLDRKLVK